MPKPPLMDDEELKQYILRKLGGGVVDVQLTEDALTDCIEDAKRWFSARKGYKGDITIDLANGANGVYVLPDDVDTVLSVQFSNSTLSDVQQFVDPMDVLTGLPFSPWTTFTSSKQGGALSSYAQMLQYMDTAGRVLGAELDWFQQNNALYILPPQTSGYARIEYKASNFTVDQLNNMDHNYVKNYALACAKETLGRVRSKYDAYPTAQGTTQMDGSVLLAEAEREKETLEEEIALSTFPAGFLMG